MHVGLSLKRDAEMTLCVNMCINQHILEKCEELQRCIYVFILIAWCDFIYGLALSYTHPHPHMHKAILDTIGCIGVFGSTSSQTRLKAAHSRAYQKMNI